MDVKLKVLEGKQAGQAVSVSTNKFFIGRAEDCQLRPASDLISRHHCALIVEDTYVGVRDFGSKNGTYVNGERVQGERELKPGDQLKVGPLAFEVVITHVVGGKKRPPVADLKAAAARTAEGSNSKFDVNEWVDEEPTEAPPKSATDTQRVDLGATTIIPVGETAESSVPSPETPTVAIPEVTKHEPGKLPPVPKHQTKDSRDAASEILNKLRKRR